MNRQQGNQERTEARVPMTRIFARDLKPGMVVRVGNEWLPVLRATLSSEGVKVNYERGQNWYALIPLHKTVSVRHYDDPDNPLLPDAAAPDFDPHIDYPERYTDGKPV